MNYQIPGHLEKSSSGLFKGHLNENKHAVSWKIMKSGHYDENKQEHTEQIGQTVYFKLNKIPDIHNTAAIWAEKSRKLAQIINKSCNLQVTKETKQRPCGFAQSRYVGKTNKEKKLKK